MGPKQHRRQPVTKKSKHNNFLDITYTHSKEGINLAVKHINNIFRQTEKEAQLK
jgi:hypothetical protein